MKNIIDKLSEEIGISDSKRQQKLVCGRKDFREYCNTLNPEFFRKDREYQNILCNTLQRAYEGKLINPDTEKKYKYLVINMPPGYGKSFTLANFATWAYGQDIRNKIITVSYNKEIAPEFSRTVRNMIADEELPDDEDYYTVRSFFPKVKLKFGESAIMKWALEGSYVSYLATSFDGTLTGMRANIGIIDDPIKNASEAVNEEVKKKHWDFFKNTFKSRMLPGALVVFVQTRWASDDLSGKVINKYPKETYVLKLTALTEDSEAGSSTCENLFPTEDLQDKRVTIDEDIWSANYMQIPIDKKGALYGTFKTYEAVDPDKYERAISYADTADEGADNLCSIMGGVIGRYGYVTDIYYTDEPMEITEPELARRLQLNEVREALIESNNGGRGFARNVIKELKLLKCLKCSVTWFFNSKKKKTRILTNATNVMDQVILPEDWKSRWPRFAKDIERYQRKGKNEHDDAPDALTGFVEFINGDVKGKKKARIGSKRRLGL